tara:strand:+ start:778 stop:891 length:114 start_codon:yes stop_codon:yes gene_type:complete
MMPIKSFFSSTTKLAGFGAKKGNLAQFFLLLDLFYDV